MGLRPGARALTELGKHQAIVLLNKTAQLIVSELLFSNTSSNLRHFSWGWWVPCSLSRSQELAYGKKAGFSPSYYLLMALGYPVVRMHALTCAEESRQSLEVVDG